MSLSKMAQTWLCFLGFAIVVHACGTGENPTTTGATSASSTSSGGAGGAGGMGGGGAGLGGTGGVPIDPRQACNDFAATMVALGCGGNFPTYPDWDSWCDDVLFDSQTECLDEFVNLMICEKETLLSFPPEQCELGCNPTEDVWAVCRETYGCYGNPLTLVQSDGMGGFLCDVKKTCFQVLYQTRCSSPEKVGAPATCECFKAGVSVGTCDQEQLGRDNGYCHVNLSKSCCNQFFGL